MTVLEASVDENDCLIFWQYYIRITRQLFDLNTEPQTTREKILPHNYLRLRILPLYRRHIATSLLGCLNISHNILFGTVGIRHLRGDLIQSL